MGGTFNPVHMGHLIMAESVMHSVNADGMLFVPSRTHPLKTNTDLVSNFEDRIQMLSLAILGNDDFIIEHPPESSPYTIDLIKYLQNKYPHANYFLPIGSDIIHEFHLWHKSREIERRIKIVTAVRPGYDVKGAKDNILRGAELVQIPQYDISSSEIRRRIKNKMSVKYMVPETVEEYIYKQGLYAE